MSDLLKVTKARARLVLDHPFFGALALRQEMIIADNYFGHPIPTAATTGKVMIFNPKFIAKLTDAEMLFLVAHEVMHSVLDHPFRRAGRNPKLWNIAGDYVINHVLVVVEQIGKMIRGGLLDRTIYDAGGGTTDGIYALLEEEADAQQKNAGPGDPGGALDEVMDCPGTAAEQAAAEAEMKVAVAQAAQAAKMMGKLSADLEKLVGEILDPKVNWADVLRNFVIKAKRDDRSFARPARRFAPMGIYAPSVDGEALGRIAVAIDYSGSVVRDVPQFGAELRAIHEDLKPAAIDVIYFDSSVKKHEVFLPDDEVVIAPKGGGGTAFSPVFRFINDLPEQPVCCVMLTDLQCTDFGPAPDYPVLFVTNDRTEAPWGEVVKM